MEPIIDFLFGELCFASRDVAKFRKRLAGDRKLAFQYESVCDPEFSRIISLPRSRVDQDVRVEKAFDLHVRHKSRRGPTGNLKASFRETRP